MVSKGIKVALVVLAFGMLFTFIYPHIPILGQSLHFVLDPTAGALLSWNPTIGMLVITAFLSLLITLAQKYLTDQNELRRLKSEQKLLQEEMKKYKDHPEKLLALQKKQLEFLPKTMDITMGSIVYTSIPLLLFFRWFYEYFAANPVQIFGFMSWFWAYLLLSLVFGMIYRKVFDMP